MHAATYAVVTLALSAAPVALPAQAQSSPAAQSPEAALDSLLATDRASAAVGLPDAIRRGANGLVLVYPGAPVVTGREAAAAMVDAQPALPAKNVRWVPLHGEVSPAGDFGITWGVTSVNEVGASAPRLGKYLAAWIRNPDGWRMVARVDAGLVASSAFARPPNLRAGTPAIARNARPMADADRAFAAMAGRDGAAEAFAAYITADGVMFPATGELVRGPDAARRLLTGPPATWRWEPVAGMASAAGDLGFTVGEATIAPPTGTPAYTKYLTLWRRGADGQLRFIADLGNGRPAPESR